MHNSACPKCGASFSTSRKKRPLALALGIVKRIINFVERGKKKKTQLPFPYDDNEKYVLFADDILLL